MNFTIDVVILISLNPCFSGSYSLSTLIVGIVEKVLVLILVLVEVTLWVLIQSTKTLAITVSLNPCFSGSYSLSTRVARHAGMLSHRLNPCFSGSYSLRTRTKSLPDFSILVLILVLVEVTLWALRIAKILQKMIGSLNPCFSGSYSLSTDNRCSWKSIRMS